MSNRPQRSLRHEYELYVENEIETYKESLPRRTILKLGDEAVGALRDEPQLALTKLRATSPTAQRPCPRKFPLPQNIGPYSHFRFR